MTSLVCEACHKCFWTVNLLQIHLRHSRAHPAGCYERLTWTMAPLLEACPIEDVDREVRHQRLRWKLLRLVMTVAMLTVNGVWRGNLRA